MGEGMLINFLTIASLLNKRDQVRAETVKLMSGPGADESESVVQIP